MEGLAPLIFFAIIGLVQLLVRWLRAAQRQQQQQQQRHPAPLPEEVEPEPPVRFPPAQLPPVTRLPIPAPLPPRVLINNRLPDDEELMVRTPARVAARAAPPPPRRMQRLDLRLGSRAEVRRAIVLMEILGPPRATASGDETQGSR